MGNDPPRQVRCGGGRLGPDNDEGVVERAKLRLRRATESDIPFIMRTERIAGYEELVGRWDEEQHRTALADHRHAYFVGDDGAATTGFAIVRDWASPERAAHIKRVAVARPGLGYGRALLAEVIDAIFRETDTHRVWIRVFPENERARRAYAAIGLRPEGIARGSAYFRGTYRDELVMAVLRPEWISDSSSQRCHQSNTT
jgi:diamine N-acetyltransferase